MSKLLIVEDDPLISRMYEKAFKASGHEIFLAGDGEKALEMLQIEGNRPNIILLDVMMPKMNGFDVLRKLEADEKLKNIPVILLTNLAGQQDAEKGLELGAVLYLVKSQYSPKEIVEKVEQIIESYGRKDNIPKVNVKTKDIPE
jgi:DNA-binding response OmpR family regulator